MEKDLVGYRFAPTEEELIKICSYEPKGLPGYRFSPTREELINYYLKNKILGKSWLVDDAISEVNVYSYEPIFLPSLSKIQSDDLVWYFFSPKVYTNAKKITMKRTKGCGFWKPTLKYRLIKDKRGRKIGIKKTLVYHKGKVANGVRTPWVMHEYHITCLPPHLVKDFSDFTVSDRLRVTNWQ